MNNRRCTLDYSIIAPVYFNEASLGSLYEELDSEVFQKLPDYTGELVFVDDGSGDGSFRVLSELHQKHPDRVRIIKLSRNFGQTSAVWCGLENALGDVTAVMSADGQDPAEMVKKMFDQYFDEGREVVISTRAGRDESKWRKATSGIFYWLMRRLCFPDMPVGGFDFVALGPKARTALLANYQHHGFLQGQIMRLGFNPCFLEYNRRAREHGQSRWTFTRKLTYLLDGIIGYSFFPLRVMSIAGIAMAILGFAYALIVLLGKLIVGNPIEGWAPLMIVILVMGGMQMLMLGIIGEYLWRTKAQVTAEPPYIVEKILENAE
jgi:polyisoprenyl-phosphate glycosyltransferase